MQLTQKGGMMRLLGVTAVALVLVGAAVAATPGWTPRDARAAARALAYPKPHAKQIACHGGGLSYRCRAVYAHHHHKTFVLAEGTEGGWTCAGHTLHTCHVLPKGFLSSAQVTGMGGLEAAAGYSSVGYIQEHLGVASPQVAGSCNASGASTFLCPYSTPAVEIRVTYRHVRGGWLVTGSG